MDPVSLGFGAANVGLELYNNISKNDEMKRLRSKQNSMMFGKVQGALDQNQSDRAGLQGSYRQQRADIREGQDTVDALASGGASQYANTNAGGDVTSAAGAGANISKATTGASMQQAGQMAGTNQMLQQNLAQNTAQQGNLAMTGAQIEDMNPWVQQQGDNMGSNLMLALQGGLSMGGKFKDAMAPEDMEELSPEVKKLMDEGMTKEEAFAELGLS